MKRDPYNLKTHGMYSTRVYKIWQCIKTRCQNPKYKYFGFYGGRGITVCKKWSDSFEAFIEDMGQPPSDKHVVDRKNTNKGYTKSNCRWVTRKENQQNLRTSKRWVIERITYNSLSEAAAAVGVSNMTVKRWCDGRAVGGQSYPPKKGCRSYTLYPQEDLK